MVRWFIQRLILKSKLFEVVHHRKNTFQVSDLCYQWSTSHPIRIQPKQSSLLLRRSYSHKGLRSSRSATAVITLALICISCTTLTIDLQPSKVRPLGQSKSPPFSHITPESSLLSATRVTQIQGSKRLSSYQCQVQPQNWLSTAALRDSAVV